MNALIEAIEILRGMWAGGPFSFTGEHYQVPGTKAGPVPAHPIGIWLGAYGPRMLRVTGQLADGWLPSLGSRDPAELGAMNAQIDEAAAGAGRDPKQVRRLVNIFGSFGNSADLLQGTPADWAEQLADLALAFGMSVFILGTDDPDRRAATPEEVCPGCASWSPRSGVSPDPGARAGTGSMRPGHVAALGPHAPVRRPEGWSSGPGPNRTRPAPRLGEPEPCRLGQPPVGARHPA